MSCLSICLLCLVCLWILRILILVFCVLWVLVRVMVLKCRLRRCLISSMFWLKRLLMVMKLFGVLCRWISSCLMSLRCWWLVGWMWRFMWELFGRWWVYRLCWWRVKRVVRWFCVILIVWNSLRWLCVGCLFRFLLCCRLCKLLLFVLFRVFWWVSCRCRCRFGCRCLWLLSSSLIFRLRFLVSRLVRVWKMVLLFLWLRCFVVWFGLCL